MTHEQFWIGLALPALVVLSYVVVGWVYVGSRRLWQELHVKFFQSVHLSVDTEYLLGEREDETSPYRNAANKFRDALSQSGRLWIFSAFGYYVLVAKQDKKKD